MNKYLAGAIACSMVMALTACGGSSSSGNKTQSSAPASSAPASSSAVAVSTSAPAVSSKPASSIATSVAASSVEAAVSSVAASSAPASSAATESSTGGVLTSSVPAISSVAASSTPASSSQAASSTPASSSAAASSEPAASSSSIGSSVAESSSSIASSVANFSSSTGSSVSSVIAQTGVFIDSAVAGIPYTTTPGNFSGVTTETGQYQYAEGDTVEFSIGEIRLPIVQAKGVVTPLDMGTDINDQVVKNIAVLLQSLDADGDTSNGITIPPAAITAAVQAVNFDQTFASFASEVLPVVQHTDNTKTVVDESVAVSHLESSISNNNAEALVGTWYIQTDEYKYMLFVLDGSHYAALDFDSVENSSAMETGIYEWNQETGVVTLSSVVRTDNDLDAMPPMADGNTLTLNDNKIVFTDDDETFELDRLVATDERPIQGGWAFEEEGMQIVFGFTGTHYFMGQSAGDDDNGQPGAEMGTYEYNSETNAIWVDTDVDANGQWGLSHPCAVLNENNAHPEYEMSNYLACGPQGRDIVQTVDVTGDTLTFTSEADTINNGGESDPFMLERVNGAIDGDIHLKMQVTLTLTDYSQGQRYDVQGGTMQCDLNAPREIGETETVNESWVLGGNPNRDTWVSTISAVYNPETKKLTFDLHEAVKPVPGHPGFYEEFWDSLDATYNKGEKNVITGTYTERYDLTWDRGPSDVSTCVATYSVVGVLR